MRECKWMQEGICVNEDCPMFCGCCPVEDESGVCGYKELQVDANAGAAGGRRC